jgi:outer membrane immunogenic protein
MAEETSLMQGNGFAMKIAKRCGTVAAVQVFGIAVLLALPALAQEESGVSSYWNGAYIGATAGYAFGHSPSTLDVRYAGDTIFSYRQNIESINANGFIGGVSIGYNHSAGPLVFGLEGDISYLGAKGRDVDKFVYAPFQNEIATKYQWLGTLRGRAGVQNGRWLAFATGGLAFGGFEDFIGGTDAVSGPVPDFGGGVKTRAGYVIGAGVEYAATGKISIKAEYLFADLGKSRTDVNAVSGEDWFGPDSPSFVNASHKLNIVRLGVNFHF